MTHTAPQHFAAVQRGWSGQAARIRTADGRSRPHFFPQIAKEMVGDVIPGQLGEVQAAMADNDPAALNAAAMQARGLG